MNDHRTPHDALRVALLAVCLGPVAGCVGDAAESETAGGERIGAAEEAVVCTTLYRGGPSPVYDADIRYDPVDPTQANTNFGLPLALSTGVAGTVTRRSLLQFDLSSIPANVPIVSASLVMRKQSSLGSGTVDLHAATSAWGEGTVTWNGFGGAFDPAIQASVVPASVPVGGFLTADLTALVTSWNQGAVANHGVLLDHPSIGRAALGSSEGLAVPNRPKLSVCYLPASCTDGLLNGAETGIDCGGSCAPCCSASPTSWDSWIGSTPTVDAVDASNPVGVTVAGQFAGTIDLGGTVYTGTNVGIGLDYYSDRYVAQYDTNGALLWASTLGYNYGYTSVASMVGDGAGATYVLENRIFPGFPDSYASAAVRRFDAAGNSAIIGGLSFLEEAYGTGLGVDAAGDVIFAGYQTYGDNSYPSEMTVGKASAAGASLWTRSFPSGAYDAVPSSRIVTDSAGNIYVSGLFGGTIDTGAGILSAFGLGADIFLIKLDASGNTLWSKVFGSTGQDKAPGLAIDAAGNPYLAGEFPGPSIDFGGGPISSAGGQTVFLAKLDGAGNQIWAKALGGAGADTLDNLNTDAGGNPYFVGNFAGAVDFGGGLVAGPSATSMFVVHYTSGGAFVSATPHQGTHAGGGVDMDCGGSLVLGGQGVGLAPGATLLPDGAFVSKVGSALSCGTGYCVGASFCDSCSCLAASDPMSITACGCSLIDPTCGVGTCSSGGAYCEGASCAAPVCYLSSSAISYEMCGGGSLVSCAIPAANKKVFVTSGTYVGDFGIAGGDAICQNLAVSAGLPGTFKAWLSQSFANPAATRMTHSVAQPYVLVDGTVVANNWADLVDGALQNAIDKTESGNPAPVVAPPAGFYGVVHPGVTPVWTGTENDGQASDDGYGNAANCGGFTQGGTPLGGSLTMILGQIATTAWSASITWDCSGTYPLYCFEQ